MRVFSFYALKLPKKNSKHISDLQGSEMGSVKSKGISYIILNVFNGCVNSIGIVKVKL